MKKAFYQMHLAILLWGFTAILGKLIHLDEGMLVWYRMLLATLSLLIFLAYKKELKFPSAKELLGIAGIGAIVAIHWITFYGAIKASNVTVAISCFSSVTLFTALLDPMMNRKLPKRYEILLALLVIAGIYIIFLVQELYLRGIVLSLISALLAAWFTILNKRISTKYEPATLTFLELGTGFLILTCLLPFWFRINGSGFVLPDFSDWIYLLLLSIFCTTVAFTISMYALQKIDAFTMNLSLNLEPLYSILLAILLFDEKDMFNIRFLLGSLLILGAVMIHGLRKSNKT